LGPVRYDFVDLRLFLHVVAEGSITAGARLAHLSLPSASERVRALERHAGVALLQRGRRGVRPTPAGVTLARHAREVLAHAARMESAVASYAIADAEPLTLLAGSSASYRLVPRALVRFLQEHPQTDVAVSERASAVTARMLTEGAADLGVVLTDVAHDTGLDTESLGDDSLVVIGRAGGVLDGQDGLTFREVVEHPMVGLAPEAPLQAAIEARAGPTAPLARYRTRTMDLGIVVELAAAGVGLAIVPRTVTGPRRVRPAGAAGTLTDSPITVCRLLDVWSQRSLSLCWGATTTRRPAALGLARHLVRAAGVDPATAL
jgi:DNA-binding transcriptional LysR family regulator